MTKIYSILIACLMLILTGCKQSRESSREAIAVSFEPQAWMVEEIAGDDFDVITLLPSGSDPEVYQPSISTMKRLGESSVYLSLGTSGFEQSLIKNISQNFPNLKIIDTAEGVDKIFGEHGIANSSNKHDGKDFDPHILASVRNSITIADNITQTLANLYPEQAEKYRDKGNALTRSLEALDEYISTMGIEGKTFLIRHPSLSYYSRDYGLNQISLSDAGKESSIVKMKERIDDSKSKKPTIMVVEEEHESPSDYSTSRQLGVDTIRVALNSPHWLNDLKRISDEIDRN